ncbi:PREDICTED: uncharacterized protein LOC104739639 isoform X3 [Camelina sativa]|uniref:Uncharacterized protein LOC104739639 isoform X1 n=1 Tax=Camelina sativa TaxID=90675 RepID=A0ABM0VMC1_CAMSA|nr:PREDICTED: uncharacterized protein LOC104739639 isoform X1 [Camelina sativa]XP_010458372.1 PREDICTED: uncharacterized protein LOC104739639 isoform X1 [Camelina sativa]XP_019090769.1 PREDICTED: uncharacterized protein LOC104739639 isoform X1 [Camelina sativa]XP_019090770.1 PREDICTED: uncharacterized protein LOC104739639 isoform X2 [Camelina sativa]XP_019090771.1 PREDICTED: uncharacterized protein LOC104739639 isoform X3 [Camelina sativa]
MECNKDEAKRAMDIAERKITEKDYNGAKKFANKAQNLFPELDGLKHLLAAIDVYISGEKNIYGEADWYGILGVDPFANDDAVKKQYRKLVLMLHPDKNKCNGAEGAFELLSQAWNQLSNPEKRLEYNIRRGKEAQRFSTTQSVIPPFQPTSNGIHNVREHVVPNARARSKPAARMDRSRVGSPPAFVPSMPKQSSTFWTKCGNCNTQYEYLRVYLNQTLLCPNCNHGFVAQEITPPSFVPKPPVNLSSNQQHRSSKNQASNKKSYGPPSSRREPAASVNHNFQWDSLTRMAGSNSRNATNQAANVVQQSQLKRELGESRERDAARGFTNSDLRNFKKPKTDDSHMRGQLAGNQTGARNVGNGNTETPNTVGSRHTHVQGMLLPCDITKALMERGQTEIFKRLPKMISEMKAKVRETDGEKKSMKATSKMSGKANEVERPVEEIPHASDEEKDDEVKTIIVPDSDFHNFDLDRSENSFKDDQIWAAYDDDDGMPRFYARIHKVISLNPFKMRISWLNSKGTSEFGPIDWMGAGFAKTCGEFRSGRHEPTDTLNAFSHKVDFTKGARGFLHILPKKGQVWALYRNWSPEWDKNTPDEVKHKYEMVEVLDDYTEDNQSVTVTLLVKAEGFRAVFRRSTDGNDVREIQKEEMLRFSHQVPHYILTGKEADNAPEGCLELDPAATP